MNDQSITKVNSIRPGCLANLFWSFTKVAQNQGAAGVDRVTIDDFSKGLSSRLKRLTKTLATEENSSHDSREYEAGKRSQPGIHHRWPNTFFANSGLFSLVTAHRLTSQSLQKKNHQPESRVREIRTYSSEGREAGNATGLPYPYLGFVSDFCRDCKSSGDYEMVTLI